MYRWCNLTTLLISAYRWFVGDLTTLLIHTYCWFVGDLTTLLIRPYRWFVGDLTTLLETRLTLPLLGWHVVRDVRVVTLLYNKKQKYECKKYTYYRLYTSAHRLMAFFTSK